MKHYDMIQWSDYVRGVGDAELRRAMRDHLATGCPECGRTAQLLRGVVDVARSDRRHGPPESAVRAVRALFALQQPTASHWLSPLRIRLAFDSLYEPAPAGVRGPETARRQLVYYAQDYALTLSLDYRPGPKGESLELGGEILRRSEGPIPEVPAYLMSGSQLLAHSFSSHLGDFHMECDPAERMRLCLLVDSAELIEIRFARTPRDGDAPAELH